MGHKQKKKPSCLTKLVGQAQKVYTELIYSHFVYILGYYELRKILAQGVRGIMPMVRAHVIIEGMVQGVFFRAHTRDQAKEYNLTGWVKNRRDGKVEAVFEGEETDVKNVLDWCHKGPAWSHVSDVQIEFEDYTGDFDDFSITYRL